MRTLRKRRALVLGSGMDAMAASVYLARSRIAVTVLEEADQVGGESLLAAAQTDADGRVSELSPDALENGTYRLVFHPPSAFFRRVELEIAIDDPGRHYHVPLLVSPYSCASYRGS